MICSIWASFIAITTSARQKTMSWTTNKKTKQTDLSAIFGKNPKKIKEVVNPIKTVEPTLNERVQVLEAALAEIAVSNLGV